ncbi:putative lipopolysaccharide biosynthesis protein [Yersinia pseudotuberculosis]|nr:putative lipopolysaccharide biosynthesis protein [Yersinia pseudotuberculosis]
MPTLSRLKDKGAIFREILRSLKFVLPAVAAASLTVWLLRDFAIWLLFSHQFTAMRDLFAWQLVGDVLKVGSYVFGYLVIAKASLRFYILAEVSQFLLLTGFCLLVNSNEWLSWCGTGVYGNVYRLFLRSVAAHSLCIVDTQHRKHSLQ